MLRQGLILLGSLCMLTACTITPHPITITPPEVRVGSTPSVQEESSTRFCPPGQAKKGRC